MSDTEMPGGAEPAEEVVAEIWIVEGEEPDAGGPRDVDPDASGDAYGWTDEPSPDADGSVAPEDDDLWEGPNFGGRA